jgi:TRAP-type C4-dicarboxylate transport system permease small subunit
MRRTAVASANAGKLAAVVTAYSNFSIGLGSLSGLSTMMLMLVIVPDVIGRKFFNSPLPGAQETGVLLLVCKIFLGLPGAQASGSNFSVTVIHGLLSPRRRRVVDVVNTAIAAVVFGLMARMSVLSAIRSTQRGEISYGVIAFPIWPGRIILATGLILLTIQLVMDVLRLVLGMDEATRPAEPEGGLYHAAPHASMDTPPHDA